MRLTYVFVALMLCFLALVYSVFMPVRIEEPKVVNIPLGTPVIKVASLLSKEGILRNPYSFLTIHVFYRKKIISGEYEFTGVLSPFEVYKTLSEGRSKLYRVTIPEGSDLLDIANILSEHGITDKDRFMALVFNPETSKRYGINLPTMEGFLFPDTYYFSRGTSPEKVVEVMYTNFLKKTQALRKELRDRKLSLERWVIIASMIEKETALNHEKPLVSAVIYNRLKMGMKLQIDPTVIYAIKIMGNWDSKLNPSELKLNSFYNTYMFKGLPPTPICNPGLESLKAALYPADVDYLYFVADGKGGHIFSKTYREHLKNIRKISR